MAFDASSAVLDESAATGFDPDSAQPEQPAFDAGSAIPDESAAVKTFKGGQDIGRGFVRGLGGTLEAIGGAIETTPTEPTGLIDTALRKMGVPIAKDVGGKILSTLGAKLKALPGERKTGAFEPSNPQWWIESLPEAAPQLAAQLGISALTKGASTAAQVGTFATTGGAMMAGNVFNESRAERLSKGESEADAHAGAAAEAAVVGTIGSALEAIPGAEFLTKGPIAALVGKVLRSPKVVNSIARGGTESVTELAQELTAIVSEAGFRGKELKAEEIIPRLKAAATLGAAIGTGASVGLDAINSRLESREQELSERVATPPATPSSPLQSPAPQAEAPAPIEQPTVQPEVVEGQASPENTVSALETKLDNILMRRRVAQSEEERAALWTEAQTIQRDIIAAEQKQEQPPEQADPEAQMEAIGASQPPAVERLQPVTETPDAIQEPIAETTVPDVPAPSGEVEAEVPAPGSDTGVSPVGEARAPEPILSQETVEAYATRLPAAQAGVVRSVLLNNMPVEQAAADAGMAPSRAQEAVAKARAYLEKAKPTALPPRTYADEPSAGRTDAIDEVAAREEGSQGPGAASEQEFAEKGAPRTTATMNRVANAERAAEGKLPVLKEAIQSNVKTFEMAESRVERNANEGRELVDALLSGRKNEVSEVDEAVLLYEKVRLRNERDMEAERASDQYSTEEDRGAARERWAAIENQLNDLDQATRRSGTIWGRMGQFRQRLMRDDFTFEAMEQKARVSKGRPLTKDESAKIKEQADRIADLEKKLAESQSKAETKSREDAMNETIRSLKQQVKASGTDSRVLAYAEKVVRSWEASATAAKKRLKERLAYTSSGVDPTILADVVIIARARIARGIVEFSKFASDAVAEFGAGIQPYLQTAWDQSQKDLDELGKEFPKQARTKVKQAVVNNPQAVQQRLVDGIKERVADGDSLSDIQRWIQKLALNFVRTGVSEREALIDAVHGVVKPVIPTLERTQTMDLISGYGDFRPLDKEPAKVTLRGLKGEMQQLGKIGDMLRKQAPKKTGMERRTMTDEERRLMREVNELKRKGGFDVTDPEKQLRSALEAIKTRLRHEIADLDFAVANKEPIINKKGEIQLDDETKALKQLRDAKKQQYDELFPKQPLTAEEQIARTEKALDRSIKQLEEDLKGGKIYGEKKSPVSSASIETKRAELNALREQREHLRDMDTATRQKQELDRLNRIGEELFQKISGEPLNRKTPPPIATTPEMQAQQQTNEALRAALAEIKEASPEGVQAKIESAIRRTVEAINEYDRRIQLGEFATAKSGASPSSPKLEALQSQRDAIRQLYLELQQQTPEAKAAKTKAQMESAQRSIDELDRQISTGDVTLAARKGQPLDVAVERLRSERDALRRLRDQLRRDALPKKTEDEIRLQAYKARAAHQIADIESRLARGDFSKREVKPVPLDPEGKKIALKLSDLKRQFMHERFMEELKNRPLPKKIFQETVHGLNTARAVMTSFDVSAPGRQGILVALGRPLTALKATGQMLKSISRSNYNDINRNILNRPNADLYKRGGLFLVDPDEYNLSKMEEAYMSRWADKIPGVGASQRAYVTFLNVLRADTFDALVRTIGRTGAPMTKERLQALANYVNIATGRGNLAGASGAAVSLNSAFFSPRLLVSRFEYLLGQPLYKGDTETRKVIATEYARTLAGAGVVMALAALAGAEIERDPRSADFLKLKFGDSRVDILGGLIPAAVFMSRMATGEKKTLSGKVQKLYKEEGRKEKMAQDDASDVIWRFIRTKLNPVIGAAINVRTGTNVIGDEVTPTKGALSLVTPLVWNDVYESMTKEGFPKGAALGLMSMLGLGVQNIEPKEQEFKIKIRP